MERDGLYGAAHTPMYDPHILPLTWWISASQLKIMMYQEKLCLNG